MIRYIFSLFIKKNSTKSYNQMTIFEQYKYEQDKFNHYALRYQYSVDDFRNLVSNEEKIYCFNMANECDKKLKELRIKILNLK